MDTLLSLEYLSPFCGVSAEDKTMEFSRLKHVADRIATDHKVTRRADWGTMKPDLSKLDMDGCYNTVVIHHTGDGSTQSLAAIERKHMQENGWSNVGYHYIVDRAGKIHEGTRQAGGHPHQDQAGRAQEMSQGAMSRIPGIILKVIALAVFALTFFTGKLTFSDDPSVALVGCMRYIGCPGDAPDARAGQHIMLSGLKESLPLEAEYDTLRRHEAISLGLLLLAFLGEPLLRRARKQRSA